MDLKILRTIKNVNQYDLALRTGIHQPKISLIERGYVKPSEHDKTALADALGVKVEEIEWGKTKEVITDA